VFHGLGGKSQVVAEPQPIKPSGPSGQPPFKLAFLWDHRPPSQLGIPFQGGIGDLALSFADNENSDINKTHGLRTSSLVGLFYSYPQLIFTTAREDKSQYCSHYLAFEKTDLEWSDLPKVT
jgi:hypothetical protein